VNALDRLDRPALTAALRELGADGWLLFDFHGVNPVLRQILGLQGMATRRLFVLLPATGEPVAVAHKIELGPLAGFPGRIVAYARWQELEAALRAVVGGKTVAMEVFPEDGVPYLDRVPHGVVQFLERLGTRVVPSAPLVSQFAARWSAADLEDHRAAAEILAEVARAELARTVRLAGTGLRETEVQGRVVEACRGQGLVFDTLPIVGFGPNSANPHYEPVAGSDAVLKAGQVVLLDLWAGRRAGAVFADQTWMGVAAREPDGEVARVWATVRDARDAAIAAVRAGARAGEPITGAAADGAARAVIEAAGYGEYFVHRTGHSIDHELHGSGPHLDGYETNDQRRLVPGIGFSVEPGVYLPGRFGMRSEVNVHLGESGPEVTPREPQRELVVAS
jgi:Xaa-Pro aminopeptidase